LFLFIYLGLVLLFQFLYVILLSFYLLLNVSFSLCKFAFEGLSLFGQKSLESLRFLRYFFSHLGNS